MDGFSQNGGHSNSPFLEDGSFPGSFQFFWGLIPHSFQPSFFPTTGPSPWVSGGFLKRKGSQGTPRATQGSLQVVHSCLNISWSLLFGRATTGPSNFSPSPSQSAPSGSQRVERRDSRCFTFDGAVGELSIRFWQPLRPSHVAAASETERKAHGLQSNEQKYSRISLSLSLYIYIDVMII